MSSHPSRLPSIELRTPAGSRAARKLVLEGRASWVIRGFHASCWHSHLAAVCQSSCGHRPLRVMPGSVQERTVRWHLEPRHHSRNIPGRDVIRTFAGNDASQGLGGNDRICGGDGDDKISGGNGSDFVHPGEGQDQDTWGGAGTDVISFAGAVGAIDLNLALRRAFVP